MSPTMNWLKKALGLSTASSSPKTDPTILRSNDTITTATGTGTSNPLPSLQTPVRKPLHAARDARMSIPVNERKAHREMLARFAARKIGGEVAWPPQQQSQSSQRRSLGTSVLKCPTTGLHVEDVGVEGEEWNGKGKGKGKARADCDKDEVGGNAPQTNATNTTTTANQSSLSPSASPSASASASASTSQDDFAPYRAYIDSQFSSRTWEKNEAAGSAGSSKSSAKRSTPGTSLEGGSLEGEAASKAASASASAVKVECEVEEM